MIKYLLTACTALALAGCGCSAAPDQAQAPQVQAPQAETARGETPAPTLTVLTARPDQAVSVTAARALAPGAPVAVAGRIGGRRDPFIAGRSAFLLADADAIAACDVNPDDHCKTPWDFCCEAKEKIAAATVLVQVVDTEGSVGTTALQGVGGMNAGSSVVITGTLSPQSTAANPIILAQAVYVEPAKP